MELWVGKSLMLPMSMVLLFCFYFYATTIQRIVVIYKDAAGIWKEDMMRCYLSCGLNLLINVLSVRYIGLYGVIGSSVFVSIVAIPWMAYILYKTVFKESSKEFYITEIKDALWAGMVCAICYFITSLLPNGLIGLLIRAVVCILIPNIILYVIYHNNYQFKNALNWTITLLSKKIERKYNHD